MTTQAPHDQHAHDGAASPEPALHAEQKSFAAPDETRTFTNGQLDRATLRRMIPFGLTNVPAYLSSMMVQVIDRPIVQSYLGLGILGIYQANYRMGFVMMVFVSLFEYASLSKSPKLMTENPKLRNS